MTGGNDKRGLYLRYKSRCRSRSFGGSWEPKKMGGGGHWGHSFAKEGSDPGLLKLNREKGKQKGKTRSGVLHGTDVRLGIEL